MVDGGSLENCWAATSRGFESLRLRKRKAAGRESDRLFLVSRPQKACFRKGGRPGTARRDNGPTAAFHPLQGLPRQGIAQADEGRAAESRRPSLLLPSRRKLAFTREGGRKQPVGTTDRQLPSTLCKDSPQGIAQADEGRAAESRRPSLLLPARRKLPSFRRSLGSHCCLYGNIC